MNAPEKGFAKYALAHIGEAHIMFDRLEDDLLELRMKKYCGYEEVPYREDSMGEVRQVLKVIDIAMEILRDALGQMQKEEESTC